VNEVRFGYSFIRHDELPQESLEDSTIGIQRSTASQYPGLPLILLARDQGGASIGTSDITYRGRTLSVSIGDILSLQRGKQSFRFGGEVLHSEWRAHAAVFSYGEIDFPTFNDFLIGNTAASQFPGGNFGFAHLGTGLTDRDFITTDYHLFVQDDWKLSSNWICPHTILKAASAASILRSTGPRWQWTAMDFRLGRQPPALSKRGMRFRDIACPA